MLVRKRELRPTERTNPTERTVTFLCRIKHAVSKNSRGISPPSPCAQLQTVAAALSDRSWSWAHKSLSPSAPKQRTNSHSSSDWLPECCCCLHGRVLPLPDFYADLDSTLVVLISKTNTPVFFRGLPSVLELDCKGAERSVYLLRKWRAKGESAARRGKIRTTERKNKREKEK